ncbi:MAG: hypothetical protein ACR2K1_08900 [Saprospiraceae bacterium]
MTALVITPASVVKSTGAVIANGTAGATITAGQSVYLDASDSKYKLADADSATTAVRAAVGLALNGAADGQPLAVQTGGDITLGSILTAGTIYVLGDVAGGIMPAADLGSGDRVMLIGVAKSATVLGMVMKGFDVGLA